MTYDLVEIAWKSVITSGLALLLLTLLKNRSAAERSWIAHAGLLATLLLPLAIVAIPRWHVEAPTSLPDVMVSNPAAAAAAAQPVVGASVPAAVAPTSSFNLETLALLLYAIPALLLLLVTLVAVVRLFALRGRASVLVEQSWLSALAHAQRRMGFKHGTALLVSNELASPVSWGILRPIILLNEEAVNSASEAEAIIAHELAHVARLDWAKLLIARAATALFWFNPLVWVLARQCHQLREEAADDAVLRSNVVSTDYAALLVGAARHESKGLLLAANGVAPGPGSLKRRVARVLDAKLSRGPARIAWTSACSAGAILISAPLSALTPVSPLPPSVTLPASLQRFAASPSISVAVDAPVTGAAPAALAQAAALSQAAAGTSVAATVSASTGAVAEAHPHPAAGVAPVAPSARPVAQPGRSPSPEMLVQMRIHGVSAAKVREFVDLGYRNLDLDDLMNMGVHGVTPSFIREMAALGYRGLSVDQLTEMRVHGVSPAYVRQFKAAGYDDLSAEELVNMRIHGVSVPGRGSSANAEARASSSDP
ncbi:MAG TPA: M56 family metallopeptidase [Allosphingosinicella sp.]|jgi:beta-lactamase regulating signal transducer with metallopeptidase domain